MKKKILILALVLLLLIVGGYLVYTKQQPKNLRTSIDTGLTNEEKKVFEEKVSKIQDEIKNLSQDARPEDKYRLYVNLGLQYYALGNLTNAKDAYLTASKILPDLPAAWGELATVEKDMGDYKKAEEYINKALSLNSGSSTYWRKKIELLQGPLGADDTQIDKAFADSLSATSNNIDILIAYAKYLEEKKDLEGAVENLRIAMEKDPANKIYYEKEILRIREKLK